MGLRWGQFWVGGWGSLRNNSRECVSLDCGVRAKWSPVDARFNRSWMALPSTSLSEAHYPSLHSRETWLSLTPKQFAARGRVITTFCSTKASFPFRCLIVSSGLTRTSNPPTHTPNAPFPVVRPAFLSQSAVSCVKPTTPPPQAICTLICHCASHCQCRYTSLPREVSREG